MSLNTHIPKFRRFVIQNFPFIEEDFDALTDYGLISKIVEFLNEVIESQNNVSDEMEYVLNYFNNLDVQDEIDNKIDEMVENGTFQSILDQYVMPYLEDLDTRLTGALNSEILNRQSTDASLQSQINSLSSGSPIPVASVSDMTNTSRTYVNTTNGKWYYYGGDSWEIGGTYQSTEIGNSSINLTMLDDSVFKNAIKSISSFEIGNIDDHGEVIEAQKRAYTTIDSLTTCDKFYVKVNDPNLTLLKISRYNGDFYVGYTNASDTSYVKSLGNSGYMITRGNAKSCKLVFTKSDDRPFTDDEVSALSMETYQTTQYQEKELYTSDTEKTTFEMGGIQANSGGLVTNTIRCRSLPATITKNVGYRYFKIDGVDGNTIVANVVLYNDGVFVRSYDHIVTNEIWYSSGHIKIYNDGTFDQLRISFRKYDNSDFTDEEVEGMSMTYIPKFKATVESKWKGKKYVALGDSITYGFIPRNYSGYPGKLNSYATLTADALEMNFVNAGISGNTVALASGGGVPMCERYVDLDNDADLITVMGGTNDIRKGVPLGTMSDRTENTFYGALHILLGGLYKKYFIDQGTTVGKTKHIVVMTPIKLLKNSGGTPGGTGILYDLDPWCEAIKEVANYYSLPVLDMYNLSNMNPHLNQTVHGTASGYTDYYNPYMTDGTHPTQEGAYIMASVLEGYLNTI